LSSVFEHSAKSLDENGSDDSSNNDNKEDDKNFPKAYSGAQFFSHFYAMFIKRTRVGLRDQRLLVCQLILPGM
jgi:hypothetical protein